jgi:hypothetical protein
MEQANLHVSTIARRTRFLLQVYVWGIDVEGSDKLSMFNNWSLILLSVDPYPDLVVIGKRMRQGPGDIAVLGGRGRGRRRRCVRYVYPYDVRARGVRGGARSRVRRHASLYAARMSDARAAGTGAAGASVRRVAVSVQAVVESL